MDETKIEKQKKSNKKISTLKYRGFIMGIATLSILFYHLPVNMNISFIQTIKSIGYSGVDLFVFCSGWGCSVSYLKNKSTFKFWSRRAKRIYPVWLLLLIAFWAPAFLFIYKKLNTQIIMTVVGNILGIQSFTGKGHVFCWYIGLLLVTYLLTPILVRFCAKSRMSNSIIIILLLILITVPFWQTNELILIFSRLPLFYIGIMFQKFWSNIKSRNMILGIGIAMIVGYTLLFIVMKTCPRDIRWGYGLYWYPCILFAPGMSLSLNWLGKRMDSSALSPIVRFISWIGKSSFEIYLLQEFVKFFVSWLIQIGRIKDGNLIWIILFIVVIFIAPLLRRAGELLGRMFED